MRTIAFIIAMCLGSPTSALEISHKLRDLRPIFPMTLDLVLTGPIEAGDGERLRTILADFHDPALREISLTLDSPGGSLVEGLEIAGILADRPEIVSASVSATCASACVLAYLGADLRYLDEGGRIGVHQFADASGEIAVDVAINAAQRLSSEIIALLTRQRVSTALFEAMAGTAPHDIHWISKDALTDWRVVTGPVFDERMEYKNIGGAVALHMVHESLFGTNQMTLMCGDGLVAFAVLEEPEIAGVGEAMVVVDGIEHAIMDLEVVNRENHRSRVLFSVPNSAALQLRDAKTVGARIYLPSGDMFYGFEQSIRDPKIREMVNSCVKPASPPALAVGAVMRRIPAIDISGNDLTQKGIRDVSFENCQQICLADRNCQAVSYIIDRRWCWPKATANGQIFAPGIISAVK